MRPTRRAPPYIAKISLDSVRTVRSKREDSTGRERLTHARDRRLADIDEIRAIGDLESQPHVDVIARWPVGKRRSRSHSEMRHGLEICEHVGARHRDRPPVDRLVA